MKDEEKPPLQLEIEWEAPEPKPLSVSEVADPDMFDLGYSGGPDLKGPMLVFHEANSALVFTGDAASKLLYVFDVLIHRVVESNSVEVGEASTAKKKVTLH